MNDITNANIWIEPESKKDQLELAEDRQILINNDLPGPVRNTWMRIKDKEIQIIYQKNENNIYTTEYQLRDTKLEIINYINYTLQDLNNYNLATNILELFKKRLIRIYSHIVEY
jgi:hypothetical protein